MPDFEAETFHEEEIKKIRLSDYKDKWAVLFFYPADFTFVCPTELEEMAEHYDEFKKLNTEILSISTDTVYTHKAWHDQSEAVKKVKFPMVADPTHKICKLMGTHILEEGMSLRGTFIIDPDGIFEGDGNKRQQYRQERQRTFTKIKSGPICARARRTSLSGKLGTRG